MKKICLTILLVTILSFNIIAQNEIKIDINKSLVNWSGSYSFDFGGHEGTVKIKKGQLFKQNGKITTGSFVLDMNTIMDVENSEDLIVHLKSEDFFEVEKYPTAKLEITKVKYHDPKNTPSSSQVYVRIHGELTIKSTTLPLWFEAEINPDNTIIDAKLKIDRTMWDVNYQSKGISASIKDRIISDAIEFKIKLLLQ